MANEVTTTVASSDQEKFLAAKLLSRTNLKLVASSLCEKMKQPRGTGATGTFVRYKRMYVPLTATSEGVDPSNNSITLETVTVTLDQWADVLTVTDIAILETSHPLLEQLIKLLADNAQRVIDREVQIVWLAGTNIQYYDGSVTTRRTVKSGHKITDAVIHKAIVTLTDAGASPRGAPANKVSVEGENSGMINGGNAFVGVAGPQVIRDIMSTGTSLGTWASTAMYGNAKALYNAEMGMWLGVRWVETNFIPKFTLLGDKTVANVSGGDFGTDTPVVTAADGGGALKSSTTFYYKVTRKDKLRGFEEAISIAHSTASAATGDTESFTFNFTGLTAGYVYNLYFDKTAAGGTAADSNLGLVTANIEVGTTVTVTAVSASTTTAPDNIRFTDDADDPTTVHVVYIHGAESCVWVGLQDLQTMISKDIATTDNPALLRKTIAYKFMAKAMIRNQSFMLQLYVASTF